jgi:hypothetical protein
MNSPISRHCHICGEDLTREAEKSSEWFAEFIQSHPDLLINFLKQYSEGEKTHLEK